MLYVVQHSFCEKEAAVIEAKYLYIRTYMYFRQCNNKIIAKRSKKKLVQKKHENNICLNDGTNELVGFTEWQINYILHKIKSNTRQPTKDKRNIKPNHILSINLMAKMKHTRAGSQSI